MMPLLSLHRVQRNFISTPQWYKTPDQSKLTDDSNTQSIKSSKELKSRIIIKMYLIKCIELVLSKSQQHVVAL